MAPRTAMISGATRLAGVIGDPVRHSLSPTLHNAAFATAGLDWVYVAFPVRPGSALEALRGTTALGIEGLSITMPHKSDALGGCASVSQDGLSLGAINTVVRGPSGALHGESTDGPGFIDALRDDGFEPAGRSCLVIGAGGAGRAVVLALARSGARRVVIVNRSAERAARAAALAPGVASVGRIEDADQCDLIVNATPQGMLGTDQPTLELARMGAGQLVNDLVYHPADTVLLLAAAAAGARPLGGLGMLLHQAARQFTLWTGESAPIEAMRAAVTEVLSARTVASASPEPTGSDATGVGDRLAPAAPGGPT